MINKTVVLQVSQRGVWTYKQLDPSHCLIRGEAIAWQESSPDLRLFSFSPQTPNFRRLFSSSSLRMCSNCGLFTRRMRSNSIEVRMRYEPVRDCALFRVPILERFPMQKSTGFVIHRAAAARLFWASSLSALLIHSWLPFS